MILTAILFWKWEGWPLLFIVRVDLDNKLVEENASLMMVAFCWTAVCYE